MNIGRSLRTLGLLAMLGLAGFAGVGCGGSSATTQEKNELIRESKKAAHQQAKTDLKRQQGAQRKASRRGPA
jgi:hypothetical protein